MRNGTSQQDATLLDVLIDGFEKNEIMDGFHWRNLPMPDEAAAVRKFAALIEEARRCKGQPARFEDAGPRRIAAWPDLEIRQIDRGIMVRARAPSSASKRPQVLAKRSALEIDHDQSTAIVSDRELARD